MLTRIVAVALFAVIARLGVWISMTLAIYKSARWITLHSVSASLLPCRCSVHHQRARRGSDEALDSSWKKTARTVVSLLHIAGLKDSGKWAPTSWQIQCALMGSQSHAGAHGRQKPPDAADIGQTVVSLL